MLANCQFPSQVSKNKHCFVAFSGGIDSTVLLNLLKAQSQQETVKLTAIHFNHYLSKNANDWAEHCKKICQLLSIPIEIIDLKINKINRRSIEQIARDCRLQAYKNITPKNSVIALAHHSSDQAETVLLNLLRGGGLSSLTGIKKLAQMDHYFLWRPLLDVNKNQIIQYAKKANLTWINDESNKQTHIRRNYLRKKIFPLLQKEWNNPENTIAKVSKRLQVQESVYHQLLNEKIERLKLKILPYSQSTLNCYQWNKYPNPLHLELLIYWLNSFNIHLEITFLNEINRQILEAESCEISCSLPNKQFVVIYKSKGQISLYLFNPSFKFQCFNSREQIKALSKRLDNQILNCRTYQGNEIIIINGKKRKLKNWYKKQMIPKYLRKRLPLLYAKNQLIAVGDIQWFGTEPLKTNR